MGKKYLMHNGHTLEPKWSYNLFNFFTDVRLIDCKRFWSTEFFVFCDKNQIWVTEIA